MPVLNSQGELIQELETPYERSLQWPRDKEKLKRLSYASFYEWLYSLHPQDALLLSCSQEFRNLVAYQRDRKWYGRIVDAAWRLFHGNR